MLLQSRVMATIGVTRGFGDHDLKVFDSNIHIKPFLSNRPQVSSVLKYPHANVRLSIPFLLDVVNWFEKTAYLVTILLVLIGGDI